MNSIKPLAIGITILSLVSCRCKPAPYIIENPCGDPPPVTEAPGMRVLDKNTGKDYFLEHPDMINKLSVQRNCTTQPVTAMFDPLTKNNQTYAYVIRFSYLPILNGPDSCRTVLLTWDNKDVDTLTFYAHMGKCVMDIDSIHYNGLSLQQVADSSGVPVRSYYTIIK